ncbi:UDP-N-acetylmuramoyl-L-alanyl-D-glutamate--2,6-diaminopimelate ligase [Lampropedia aestuarii]|uniref:UDP-N-acetylmuramoyl-L-alanyl-D-glutamate--2, 6-diaminopimelate ligase n=1 Tax=Lampropedia aestuarii TaxID=2562762 RepID=UPI002469B96B|nr:UDP-N-acetylmuramoyl-L-alanyl-D-glutamate--2,6-diaminopimelate ligase [Lampropedia aestuarii]MDH5856340.1 UDP-N-acetylmuramoyl-L-alanyl-D-glutamate--2,6-diaminopimelate ligase [Lampropedia aestuarii]
MSVHLQTVDAVIAWLQQHAQAGAVLRSDSRRIAPGDVFLAWPGHAGDGRAHIDTALQAGAVAVVMEGQAGQPVPDTQPAGVAIATFEGLYRASGAIASRWYGQPSQAMQLAAITGTNGKTTVAWWLAHALSQAGKLCGYVGTLGIGVGHQVKASGLTSPEAVQLQQSLRDMQQQGVQACAIEASSIGLDQGRLDGAAIDSAVFTNLSQDHLDYHSTMQAYGQAKRMLFDWPGLSSAVVNVQDAFGAALAHDLQQRADLQLWTFAVQAPGLPAALARLEASALNFAAGLASFTVTEYAAAHTPVGLPREVLAAQAVQAPVVGLYNVQNALAVVAALRALGYSLADAAQLVLHLPAVAGRMQVVPVADEAAGALPLVVVDYAHTPDALRAALQALRPVAEQRHGQLQVVFGCGGDRDSSKRALMAMAAAQHADKVWITSDNPRSEKPEHIIAQIVQGLTQAQRSQALVEPDRSAAIHAAVAQAQPGDVLLLAGKGHEPYQEIKGVQHPFSDVQQAQDALAQRVAVVLKRLQNKEVSA